MTTSKLFANSFATFFPIRGHQNVRVEKGNNLALRPPPQTDSTTIITVDAASNLHLISPLIYNVEFASSDELKQLYAP